MKKFLQIVFSLLFSAAAFAQQLVIQQNNSLHVYPPSTKILATVANHTIESNSVKNISEQKRFIVELQDTPNILEKNNRFQKSAVSIDKKAFRRKIEKLVNRLQSVVEFSEAISGFSFSATSEEIRNISLLNGVKKIYPDLTVTAQPVAASASLSVSQMKMIKIGDGSGVKVGIIDTGIDYLHDALGRGFGEGYKVCGGYDFVNHDSDPMDDNGHGTHVAGIIGGSSDELQGMAEGVKIYSYKALDQDGSGYVSDVLSAIEQAIKDNVQILNLSLSSPGGDAHDILSEAVNRAVEAGIVVVVAAGNFSDYGTIGSPGAAENALTVGAVDNDGNVASFSSKGPTVESYGIKPDIVAPGVGVLSCKLGGGYMAMSGTSMAAPFVTGLAASLRKLHPEWSAYEIRNAIIESAENLPQSVFVSGSGMVNPLQSIHLTSSVSPSNISFGFASTQNESWNQSRTLSIKNETNEELSYVISPQTIAGISVRITPQSFQLKPKEEKIISLELNASMTMLPNNKSLQDGYVGKIAVTTQYDTITIPFGFFKGNVLQVNFDETPWQTVILNNKGLVKSLNPQKNNVTLIVSEGTYDILTNFYSSHYVVKENIPVAGSTIVDVAKSDASHKVTLQLVDENNEPFNSESANYSLSTLEGMFNTTIGASVISMSGSRLNTTGSASFEKYISSFSSKYIFGYAANCMEGNTTTYSFEAALEHGIKSDTVINFAAEQNKKLEVRYDLDSNNVKRVFPITWTGIKDNSRLVSVSFYDEAAAGLYYPFQQTTYFRGVSSSKFPLFHYREAYTF